CSPARNVTDAACSIFRSSAISKIVRGCSAQSNVFLTLSLIILMLLFFVLAVIRRIPHPARCRRQAGRTLCSGTGTSQCRDPRGGTPACDLCALNWRHTQSPPACHTGIGLCESGGSCRCCSRFR